MWKFIIRKNDQEEIDYVLRTEDGRVVLKSRKYSSDNACRKGIASVSRNSRLANLEEMDNRVIGKVIKHPKYEVYPVGEDAYGFHLKASNGQVVGVSGRYNSKDACLKAIEELRRHASEAIVDEE